MLVAAQSPTEAPPAEVDESAIVVTGRALSEEEAREQATAFVRSTGVARGETPAARWVVPVCPKVTGVSVDSARSAEARLRMIAAQAGIDVAREPCAANLVISFAPDPAGVVQEVERRSPRRLSEVPRGAKEALLTGSAPVRWWYTTETLGRHGQRARNLPPPRSEGEPPGSGGSVIPNVPTMMHYENSNISTLAQRTIMSASVIIDAKAIDGLPLEAVIAYAAMVGFAEIRDLDATPQGSILQLFELAAPPRDLTQQDRAFLHALYRISLDRQALRHRGNLVREMMAALSRE